MPFVLSEILIQIYFTSHKYLFSNEISDHEDNFDIGLPTQQNNIDNENFSVNTGNNFAKKTR